MQSENGFFEKIKNVGHELSPKQKQLANYIMENYKTVAFKKLTQLARDANVSESTVVRLTAYLGYSGFSEMMEDLQKLVQHELYVLDSIKSNISDKHLKELNILETIINNEQTHVNKLLDSVSVDEIEKVVDAIEKSNKVILVGFNFSSFLVEFMGYNLGKLKYNVDVINRDSIRVNNLVLSCDENTVVVLFSFPRYPKKMQQLGNIFKKRGASVIGISDSILSPLKVVSDQLLVVPLNFMSFTDPCISILIVIQAIIMEYISRNPEKTEDYLQQFDDYVREMDIF